MVEYITLQEAKLYLRVDHDEEDDLILGFVCAAFEMCEHHLQKCFVDEYPDADSIPKTIRQAAFFLVGHFYENRIAVSAVSMMEVPLAVKNLLDPHREHPFA